MVCASETKERGPQPQTSEIIKRRQREISPACQKPTQGSTKPCSARVFKDTHYFKRWWISKAFHFCVFLKKITQWSCAYRIKEGIFFFFNQTQHQFLHHTGIIFLLAKWALVWMSPRFRGLCPRDLCAVCICNFQTRNCRWILGLNLFSYG